jgi:hypothetical protein
MNEVTNLIGSSHTGTAADSGIAPGSDTELERSECFQRLNKSAAASVPRGDGEFM